MMMYYMCKIKIWEDFLYPPSVSVELGSSVTSVSIVSGWLRFDPQQRRKDYFSSLCVKTGSGAHPDSCTMGTGGSLPRANVQLGRDTDCSPPSAAEVENE
jgi:hypothetical protein